MIIIQDILISDDIVESHFMCNLNACKGACCWEGDYGAPLEPGEMNTLDREWKKIAPFLPPESRKKIAEEGSYTYYRENECHGTHLHENGACVFLTYDQNGIAQCGIEKAWNAGESSMQKPLSCHLYPIRVEKLNQTGTEALNYDRWDICRAACSRGKKEEMPLYRFVKDALIRKYGESFYNELEAASGYIKKTGKH